MFKYYNCYCFSNGDFIEKDAYEIDLQDALKLVNSDKSVFVWIGGWTSTPLNELLEIDRSKVMDANPYELLERENYPKELEKYERPIFVCHHGISSYELVRELENNNIKAYSLFGGTEGIKNPGQ
jgi:rhodanese-related sulfurtransferase